MVTCIVVGPEIEGNLGFLARTLANFDVEQLVLVDPQVSVGQEARDRAVHAQDMLEDVEIYDSFEEVAGQFDTLVGTTARDASRSNVLRNPVTPRQMAEQLDAVDDETAVVLGRESTGLTNDELDICDLVVSIPTAEDYRSMNITHAAAVLFYEIHVTATDSARAEGTPREQKQALTEIFKNIMTQLDYSGDYQERTERCFRNLIGRAYIRQEETNTLMGFFRQVESRLGDE